MDNLFKLQEDQQHQQQNDLQNLDQPSTLNITFSRLNNKFSRSGYSEEMSQGRLTNLQFDNFLTSIETHVDNFFYELLVQYIHILMIFSIILIGIYSVIVRIIIKGRREKSEISNMQTRTIFLFICWIFNLLIKQFYLPKYYMSKIEKFLDYHNILVYHQDKLAWTVGPQCQYLRLCLRYPEAFVELQLEQQQFHEINDMGYQMLHEFDDEDNQLQMIDDVIIQKEVLEGEEEFYQNDEDLKIMDEKYDLLGDIGLEVNDQNDQDDQDEKVEDLFDNENLLLEEEEEEVVVQKKVEDEKNTPQEEKALTELQSNDLPKITNPKKHQQQSEKSTKQPKNQHQQLKKKEQALQKEQEEEGLENIF